MAWSATTSLLPGLGRGHAPTRCAPTCCAVLGRRVDVGGGFGVVHREASRSRRAPVALGVDRSSAFSAARARTGVGAMPEERDGRTLHRRPRRRARPRRPRPARAKSPLRRAISSTANPARPGHTGKWTAGEDLVLADRGGPGADEELGGRDAAGPAAPGDLELGVERQRDRRELGRGVGVRDRPADGAAVADLEVTDQRDGLGEQRHGLAGRMRRARPRSGGSSTSR